jgi:hypothetical protein
VAARTQIRRLPDARPAGPRCCPAVDPHRARRTPKYPAIAAAVASLPARQAYLDGELCGVRPDGTTSFSLIQNASDTGNAEALVFFLFDLLHLDGEAIASMPVTQRKERLRALLSGAGSPLHFSDHQIGHGQAFYDHACALRVEGIVSKRVDAPYAPGNRGLWVKVKCLNREETHPSSCRRRIKPIDLSGGGPRSATNRPKQVASPGAALSARRAHRFGWIDVSHLPSSSGERPCPSNAIRP